MKCFKTFCLTLVFVIMAGTLSFAAADEFDVSTGKPASASGTEASSDPSRANDGSYTSFWECDWRNIHEFWWQVDLEKMQRISKIEVFFRNANVSERSNLEIQASNDPNFKTYTVLGSIGQEPREGDANWTITTDRSELYRYVRYQKTEAAYTLLVELKVYAVFTDVNVLQSGYTDESGAAQTEITAGKQVGFWADIKNYQINQNASAKVLLVLYKGDVICDLDFVSYDTIAPQATQKVTLLMNTVLPSHVSEYSARAFIFNNFGELLGIDHYTSEVLRPKEVQE